MTSLLRPALGLLVTLSVLTGLVYPAVVTGLAQAAFGEQADGSLIESGDGWLGSTQIGQTFSDPGHFWSRPSAIYVQTIAWLMDGTLLRGAFATLKTVGAGMVIGGGIGIACGR